MAAELEQLRVSLVAELVGREAFEQLKREVNQVKAATAGLDDTQKKLRTTVTDAEKAVRAQRQAFAQGGMQINQFAGQIAAGTSPMTAFVQQIGDVAYVVGQAGDSMGKVGRFLQGPWAAAILVAISVLGPLIAKLWESKDAAEEAETAFSRFLTSMQATSKVSDVFSENSVKIAETKGRVSQLTAELAKLQATPVEFRGEAAFAAESTARKDRIRTIQKEIAAGNSLIQQAESNIQTTIQLVKLQRQRAAAEEAIAKKSDKSSKRPSSGRDSSSKVDKSKEDVQTLADLMGEIQNGSAIFGREFVKDMDKVGLSIEKSGLESLGENIAKSIETVKPALEQMQRPIDQVKSMSQAMGQSFSDGIKGMITGAMSFKQVMTNVIDSVINKLFEMFVVQQITGMIETGLKSIFLPGKAIGGPVQGGKPYLVGERGPELFVPSRSGSIVPNKSLGGGMTINVDARGASDPAAVRAQVEMGIAQAAPYIIAAAQNKTLTTAARPRLPGTLG